MAKVTKLKLDLQTGTTNTIFATWSFSKSKVDFYRIYWYYATGDGKWFKHGYEDVTSKQATFSRPSNATKVKAKVKPVSKKHKVRGKMKSYWTGTYVSKEYSTASDPPPTPSVPTVTVDKYKLTAYVDVPGDLKITDRIEFYIISGSKKVTSGVKGISNSTITRRVTFSCNITAGKKYRVRARAINVNTKGTIIGRSAWSEYSNEVSTIPSTVTGVKCSVDSKTSVKVSWTKNSTAKSYQVEYATKKEYFSSSSQVSSTTVENSYAYITGLESGHTWFFRVRAVNDQGESGWSSIVSTILGSKPEPPTTWSLTTTAIVGETVTLYWVHNSEDGSKQKAAQILLTMNGLASEIINVDTPATDKDDDETAKIYSYILDLSSYIDGAEVLWQVRTKGITDEYSDWSVQRTIDIYAPPTLELALDGANEVTGDNTLTTLPYNITATAGPNTQTPISYYVSITAKETYEAEDEVGNTVIVNEGQSVYSKIFNISENPFLIKLEAGDISLENNQIYNVTVNVSMNSGLVAEACDTFTVVWDDYTYEPDASIVVDEDTLAAYISPFCVDESEVLINDIFLSVYRRQYDGSFVEIANGLENDGLITVTDPHPALDYARYRIVARSKTTGVIGYEDLPGEPIGEPSIVIQWDEKWSQFDYVEEDQTDAPEIPPWTGSMLRLPYNVDISESHDNDVSLISYIGRNHPVSYYGTQRGEAATWNTVIAKTDKETLYALRRLSTWTDDVYIREPSGTGYWAQISVGIAIKHMDLTIPVTLTIKRVEGGI